jgi:hypothetical protein
MSLGRYRITWPELCKKQMTDSPKVLRVLCVCSSVFILLVVNKH